MADSSLVRILIGVAVVAAAAGFAGAAWGAERRRVLKAPLALDEAIGRLVLFSDAACARCDEARRVLETVGRPFREVAYDTDPEVMRRAGVGAVPLIVVRRADGREVGRIAGKVSPRRLRRLLATAEL